MIILWRSVVQFCSAPPVHFPTALDKEAHIIAVACSKAPQGHRRWTLRLLADKVVELGFCESFSHEAIRKILKKTNSSHGRRFSGASLR